MEPKKSRRIRIEPHPDPVRGKRGEKIKALAMDFSVKEEHSNVYELEDGTKVRVRAYASRFNKALDEHTEKPIVNPKGEPMYGVELSIETNFEYSEEALKDVGRS